MSCGKYCVKHLVVYVGRYFLLIFTSGLAPEIMTTSEYTMYLDKPAGTETITYGIRTSEIKFYYILLQLREC
jgi:hypothetical protein